MRIDSVIMYASVFSAALPLTGGWLKIKWLNQQEQLILWLITISFGSDLFMWTLSSFGLNNMPVAHTYGLVEGILLIVYFKALLSIPMLRYGAFLFTITYVFNSLFLESVFQFNAYSRSTEALLIVCLCLYALYQFYDKAEEFFIDQSPSFWIVIALLVYFSGALFSFLLSTNILSQSPDRFYNSWILHNVSNLTKNLLLLIAWWKVKTI